MPTTPNPERLRIRMEPGIKRIVLKVLVGHCPACDVQIETGQEEALKQYIKGLVLKFDCPKCKVPLKTERSNIVVPAAGLAKPQGKLIVDAK